MYRWLSVGRCQRAASPASVSTRTPSKLRKQLSFSPRLRRLPFFSLSSPSSVVQSDMALNHPKQKFLSIPNPVYFQQRHYSSSSNHTDNEDSAQEEAPVSPVVEEQQRRKRIVRRKAASWWCLNKAEAQARLAPDSSDENLDVFPEDGQPFWPGSGKTNRRAPALPRFSSAESRSRRIFSNLKLSFLSHMHKENNKQLMDKPLVFGGTFPIDMPLECANEPFIKKPTVVDRPPVRTFAIDEPITCASWEPPVNPFVRRPDEHFAPTFDIDEPLSV